MATAVLFYGHFIFLSFTIFISLPCSTIGTNGFAVDLIHRDSPLSPLYNPQTNFWDRAEKSYEISVARYGYLTSKVRSNRYQIDVIPNDFAFLAKLNVGEPPVDVFAVLDTGSDVFWIQCNPCDHCQRQTKPVYDRIKSTTFRSVACRSSHCKILPNTSCDKKRLCTYKLRYADGSYSKGILGYEFISFTNPSNGIKATITNVIFGCGVDNSISVTGQVGGILGLSSEEISLVTQLNTNPIKSQFSYCLGNVSDPSSKGNLIIGEDAHIAGFTTPFTFYAGLYKVQVVDVKVGSQSLDLPPGAFGPPDGSVILDSGATFSFIPPKAHDKLADVIYQTLKRFNIQPIPSKKVGMRCFRGNIGKDLNGFPTMTISFKGHATLVLEKWSTFVQVEESRFCLAFTHTRGPHKPSVIGSLAQQFYNFGFDLVEKELSIIHSICVY